MTEEKRRLMEGNDQTPRLDLNSEREIASGTSVIRIRDGIWLLY